MCICRLIGSLFFGLALFLADCSAVGQTILREYWLRLPGSALADLTNSANFSDYPTGKTYPDIFEAPSQWADEYGTRMRGYVHPPTTGTYVFWISGDDQSQLLLSTDEDPTHKRPIARVITWTGSRVWEEARDGNNLVQKSAGISLQAGRKYYIEALQKEGGGGDNLAVGWRLPNGTLERPIPGNRLSAFQVSTSAPTILAQPLDVDVAEGEQAVFQVTAKGFQPMAFQWQQDGVNLPGETTPTYLAPVVMLADSGTKFRCIITNQLGSIVSREATLTVHPETTPPTVRTLNPPPNVTVRNLAQVEVTFSEPVTGVDAADLLINGQAATNLIGTAMGPYIFQFARPSAGPVQFFWTLSHGIADTALIPNLFAAGAWGVALNPDLEAPGVVINELVAANENGLQDEDAEPQDWIEIYNPGPAAVNLAGWSLTDDAGQPDQWIFPAITLGSHRYLIVFASGKDRRPTAANAKLHTNFKLGRAGEYLGLFNAESPRQAVSDLAPQFPEQRNDYSYGRDSAGEWRYFVKPTPGAANGLSAIESVLPPPHFSVQRGFFNAAFHLILSTRAEGAVIRYTRDGSEPTEANGTLHTGPILINTTTLLRAATLRTNCLPSVVMTHTYLKWIADGAGTKGFDHVNFTLDSQGETLRIDNSNTNIIDSVDFGLQQPGVSEGRLPDGGTSVARFPASPTPRESNYLPLTNPVINEVLTHPDAPLEDAIELHNVSSEPVRLGGWFISNSENNLKKYRIPEGTVLPALRYLVFYEQHFNANPGVPPSFTLNSAHGDEVILSSADAAGNLTGYRAVVRFGAAENGVSFGRYRPSAGVDFVAMSRRTFGADAPSSLAEFRLGNGVENAAPLTDPVVINEIMYHPPEGADEVENSDLEFIELYNLTEADVALYDPNHPRNTWKLGNAVDFVFPRNVTLPTKSHLLVVGFDPGSSAAALVAFRSQYGVSANTRIYGPWKGRLANSRQSVELSKPDPPQQPPHPDAGFVPYVLVDRIEYRDEAPWAPEADGSGASLQRLNSGAYGNEPLNWTANFPTAGRANDTSLPDTDQDGLPNSWENAYGLNTKDNRDAALDADGDGLTALQEHLSGTDPRDPQSYLQIGIGNGEPGRPILRFQAVAGKTYSVLFRDSATGGAWQKLFDVGALEITQTIERADTTVMGAETRFYRLVTPAMP